MVTAALIPLRVDHLSKRYRLRTGGFTDAVSDISFEVAAGECFGLLGPNGAGKSSAIHCISGFYPASAGQVFINGHDVHVHPKRARRVLGVCSQEETLDSDFSVFDQLVRHATYFRIPIPTARERAGALLERFGLSDKADDPVESLSGGLRRRCRWRVR
jgi:ABC-type multidrug transport system ATPase subunit